MTDAKGKRILLLYISENSGHHRASLAVEQALKLLDGDVKTRCVNSFQYTNPILEKIIHKTYMAVIKRKPQVWEYLYDNPDIVKKTRRLKEVIHKHNSAKMKLLLDGFNPDAVACTQAFPCGIMADIKKTFGVSFPLFGILTDYAPHSYWIYDNVDAYIVPSEETGRKLIQSGIARSKIKPFGIPVDPKFYSRGDRNEIAKKYGLDPDIPTALLMGGGQGLGPIKNVVALLDRSNINMQAIVIAGTNRKLYSSLTKARETSSKKIVVLAYSESVNELMDISSVIMTKPGGITTAEAMAKNLPIIIVNPLPGQEAMNSDFLLDNGLAVKANGHQEAVGLLEDLLLDPDKLAAMRNNMKKIMKPEPSLAIAKFILEASQ